MLLDEASIRLVGLEGHTCATEVDGREEAAELGRRRADEVIAYLVQAGVEPSRLVAKTYGSERPLAPIGTAEGCARSRRVELSIYERDD